MHDIEEESDDYSNEDTNEKENVNMRQSNRNMKRKPSGSGKGSEGGLAEEYGSFCQFKLKGVFFLQANFQTSASTNISAPKTRAFPTFVRKV